jgi:hypothetical protein
MSPYREPRPADFCRHADYQVTLSPEELQALREYVQTQPVPSPAVPVTPRRLRLCKAKRRVRRERWRAAEKTAAVLGLFCVAVWMAFFYAYYLRSRPPLQVTIPGSGQDGRRNSLRDTPLENRRLVRGNSPAIISGSR